MHGRRFRAVAAAGTLQGRVRVTSSLRVAAESTLQSTHRAVDQSARRILSSTSRTHPYRPCTIPVHPNLPSPTASLFIPLTTSSGTSDPPPTPPPSRSTYPARWRSTTHPSCQGQQCDNDRLSRPPLRRKYCGIVVVLKLIFIHFSKKNYSTFECGENVSKIQNHLISRAYECLRPLRLPNDDDDIPKYPYLCVTCERE